MSDDQIEATETAPEQTEATENSASEPVQQKPTETVEFWKQKAREQESRAKSNAAAAKRLAEIEEQNKSESQRLADQLAAAQADADKARAESLRWRIAAKHGIGDDDADLFLTGTDEDTLTRQAERLASRAPVSKGTVVPSAGKQPGEAPSLDTQIAAAQESGDIAAVMALKSQKLAGLAGKN